MAVTLHDHITSPVVFGNIYIFLIINDTSENNGNYMIVPYSVFRFMYNNKF